MVCPSSAANLTMQRRSEAPSPVPGSSIDLAVIDFARHLGSNSPPISETNDPVPWWQEGSTTLLSGPAGSLKNRFAEEFCKVRGSEEQCALSIHFGHDLPWASLAQGQPKIARAGAGLRYEVRYPECIPVHYYLFRGSYLSAGQILDEMRSFLDARRRELVTVKRAVIGDFANLSSQFPFLQQDPLFIPTLRDLLMIRGITSTLIYTPSERADHEEVYDQLRTLSHNVLHFQSQSEHGRATFRLRVESSLTNQHYSGPVEIRDGVNGLQVINTLDLEAEDGGLLEVIIRLDAGTSLQQRYNSLLTTNLSPTYRIETSATVTEFGRRESPQFASRREQGLRIVMVDAHSVPSTTESGSFQSLESRGQRAGRIQELWTSSKENHDLLRMLHYDGCYDSKEPPNRLFSVPYFLNPSILVVREEFAHYLEDNRQDWIDPCSEEIEVPSWPDLLVALREASSSESKFNGLRLFSFRKEGPETLNCLFFEIVYSLTGDDRLICKLCQLFGKAPAFEESEWAHLAKAISIMQELTNIMEQPAEKEP